VNVSQTGTGVQTSVGGKWMGAGATRCIRAVKKDDRISLQSKAFILHNQLSVNDICCSRNPVICANVKKLRVESHFGDSYSVFSPRVAVVGWERLGLMQGEQ
jgi:hypothetical protein